MASISVQDLRRRLYVKAKSEPTWRFWGLYVHVCKLETLREAYGVAKSNDGAPDHPPTHVRIHMYMPGAVGFVTLWEGWTRPATLPYSAIRGGWFGS